MDISCFQHLAPTAERQLREDEYLREEDQMICCKNCHTPRERYLEILGHTFKPRMLCKCQDKKMKREEEEDRKRRLQEQISRNRSIGLPDPELRKHTFQNDLGYNVTQMQVAKNYVAHWEDFRKKGMGLLFWGKVGTGKSFMAGCIANALLDKGVRVIMTNFSRLLNCLTDLRFSQRNSFIDNLISYPLLIIDDLGIERNSDYAREQVFSIIDSRYRTGLPMIITTNLELDEMMNATNTDKSRIYNRILERCCPLECNEINIRNHIASQAHAEAQGVLRH